MAAAIPAVALVTGASRGIGRATAQQLAARGVRVALNYHRNDAAAQDTISSLPGSDHALFKADISDPAACVTLIAAVPEWTTAVLPKSTVAPQLQLAQLFCSESV